MRQGRSREARGQTPRSCRVRNRSGGRHGLAPLAAPRLPRRVPEAIFGARLPCTSPEVLHSCPEPGSHRSHGPRPRNRRLFRRRADGSRRRSQVRQRGERKAAVNLHLRRRLERGPGHRRVAARDERRRGRHAARRRDRDRLRRKRRPGPGGPSGLHLRVQRVPTLRRERDGPRGAPDHRPRSRPRRATSCRARPNPDGPGARPGLLGFSSWAAETPSTRRISTVPPGSCEGGAGGRGDRAPDPDPDATPSSAVRRTARLGPRVQSRAVIRNTQA